MHQNFRRKIFVEIRRIEKVQITNFQALCLDRVFSGPEKKTDVIDDVTTQGRFSADQEQRLSLK